MKTFFLIPALILTASFCNGQETHKVKPLTVDDRPEGYALISYRIPEDGLYSFSVNGGFTPKKSSTIYYCEYQLQLRSNEKSGNQTEINVATQAQDGNVCYFGTNQKKNTVTGVFHKDEQVELCIIVHKSDVNGNPHNQLFLTKDTEVLVKQIKPDITSK